MYTDETMNTIFIRVLYREIQWKVSKSKYRVRKTSTYNTCVLKEIPSMTFVFFMVWIKISTLARWDKSPGDHR